MKRFFKFAAVAAITAAFVSCTEKPEPDNQGTTVERTEDLTFTLSVTSVTESEAKIKVEHNGTTNDTWYGFATTESNVNTAIQNKVKELTSGTNSISGLKKSKSTTVTVKNLEPSTDYTYVVFGVTTAGEVYGIYNSVKFTTERDMSILEETDEWNISYARGEDEGEIVELFSIEGNSGFYFTTVGTNVLEANEMTVADYVSYVINTEIPTYLSYGYKWSDLYVPESYILKYPRMVSGDYIAMAIGFDSKGNPSGTYSTQEFTVVEEAAAAEYTQWLGNWDVIDAYQYQDETTGEIVQAESVYHITLHHYDNNYMYIMTGWEENTDEAYNDIRDWVGEYAVPVYYNNGKLEFCETTLDYINFGEAYGDYYFGFYGLGNVTSGSQIYEGTLVAQDGLVMAVGEMGVEGQAATITGNTVTTSQFSVEYLGMFFCGYPANGEGSLAYWNYPMEFPLDMVKSDSAAASLQSVTAPYATATSIEADSMRKLSRKTFTPRYL